MTASKLLIVAAVVGLVSLAIVQSVPESGRPALGSKGDRCGFIPRPSPTSAVRTAPAPALATSLLNGLPMTFEENRGQFSCDAAYVGKARGAKVFVEHDAITLQFLEREPAASPPPRGSFRGEPPEPARITRYLNVRFGFEGANQAATPEATRPLPGIVNYFIGNDPSQWRTEIPTCSEVAIRELYPGVDLRLYSGPESGLEYDLELAPHAAVEQIAVRCEGADALSLAEDGTVLLVHTAFGTIRQTIPAVWEITPDRERHSLACRFRLLDSEGFGFDVPDRDPALALMIDPGLIWSTYLGGGLSGGCCDKAIDVAVGASGEVTVVGHSRADDFPTTPGAFDTTFNNPGSYLHDVFVTRISSSGSGLVYSTFLGGTHIDYGTGVALDATGAAVVVGTTSSTGFPTTSGAYDVTHNGFEDVFVSKLSSTGSSLIFSSFLGSSGNDRGHGVALDANGAPALVGYAVAGFPVTPGAYDTTFNGGMQDAFVARVDSSGSTLVYATFLGGPGDDSASDVCLDVAGVASVVGGTNSATFPTTPGSFDSSHNGGSDAFVTRLNAQGTSLLYSTFLGGVGYDWGGSLVQSSIGVITVCGGTQSSTGFPTTSSAYDTSYNGGGDAFVTRLEPSGASLIYSTFLGGSSGDGASGIAEDATGGVVLTGSTYSGDFPTTVGAFDVSFNLGTTPKRDVFVSRLTSSGSQLRYSTFLGGTEDDLCFSVAVDDTGDATAVGTSGAGFPVTSGAVQPTFIGFQSDAFITRIDLLPTGAARYGTSSPGCLGPVVIGVTSIPQQGNPAFGITCGHAPVNGTGILGISSGSLSTPVVALGAQIWIDVAAPVFFYVPVTSNGIGASEVALPLPANPALVGLQAYAQFAWADVCAPGYMSTSAGLAVTIQ